MSLSQDGDIEQLDKHSLYSNESIELTELNPSDNASDKFLNIDSQYKQSPEVPEQLVSHVSNKDYQGDVHDRHRLIGQKLSNSSDKTATTVHSYKGPSYIVKSDEPKPPSSWTHSVRSVCNKICPIFKPPRQYSNSESRPSTRTSYDSSPYSGSIRHPDDIAFDPHSKYSYWWDYIVSLAFMYNFWVIGFRYAFYEIESDTMLAWFILDYTADLIYCLDILKHFKTGFLENGILQIDPIRMRKHYFNSTQFYIDILCLLPLDFLYLSIGFNSLLRSFRLVKIYKYWNFLDFTERHSQQPNVIRTANMMHYLCAIFHWNAALVFIVMKHSDNVEWFSLATNTTTNVKQVYIGALYWSISALTTMGLPFTPATDGERMFFIFEMVFALLLFAAVIGNMSNIIASISSSKKEFQTKLDEVKNYMREADIPSTLQKRVIRLFDYQWSSKKSVYEPKECSILPDRLKVELAIHSHLDTLKMVEIFQNTEAGFLKELVVKLRHNLYSPGDYICKKGEVGKEMYIVKTGRLHIVDDDDRVKVILTPGCYFGEISVLGIGGEGNHRTASVKSVGFSDLFCLNKDDLWSVLQEYPAARHRLESIALKRLESQFQHSMDNEPSELCDGKGIVVEEKNPNECFVSCDSAREPHLPNIQIKLPSDESDVSSQYPVFYNNCADAPSPAPSVFFDRCSPDDYNSFDGKRVEDPRFLVRQSPQESMYSCRTPTKFHRCASMDYYSKPANRKLHDQRSFCEGIAYPDYYFSREQLGHNVATSRPRRQSSDGDSISVQSRKSIARAPPRCRSATPCIEEPTGAIHRQNSQAGRRPTLVHQSKIDQPINDNNFLRPVLYDSSQLKTDRGAEVQNMRRSYQNVDRIDRHLYAEPCESYDTRFLLGVEPQPNHTPNTSRQSQDDEIQITLPVPKKHQAKKSLPQSSQESFPSVEDLSRVSPYFTSTSLYTTQDYHPPSVAEPSTAHTAGAPSTSAAGFLSTTNCHSDDPGTQHQLKPNGNLRHQRDTAR